MAGQEGGLGRSRAADARTPTWAQELLDHLRPTGRDVRRIVAWLAETLRGTASLQDHTGTLVAGTRLPLDEGLVADILAGRIASAAAADEDGHLRLVRIEQPHQASAGVLAVARPEPFDRRASDILTHTVQVLELLLRAREATAAGRRLKRATSDLRLAILQLLMVEDTVSARRVAAGLWPGLLDTETACVYVLEGDAAERDRLAEECLGVTGDRALVVRCPAMDGHVIIVTTADAAGEALRSLVDRNPGTLLGGSSRQSLARTATAYGQAVSALAVARVRPDKAAVYAERTHPERLMDPAALREWTARLLRPLDTLPHHTRAELLATTRLGLEFTAVSAAKVLGVSRNTVRARMERVESLLRTDFTDLTVRATVHLALSTQVSLADGQGDHGGTPQARARLGDLLAGPALGTWARELLGRLDGDARDLRRTLRSWIAAGGNAERAAQTLAVHPQTVREHVRSAEPVLERRLIASGSDLYEVVLAHLATGELEHPVLLRDNPGHPDAPVHG
ncbi:PucR family transcriptional regulator [Streptomyces canus]|uniref:PucR family transcriptional regulator n=1 Tax=Streptomyces canus TaxID=58343 RepID=A0A124HW89_9ACTN|nr:MULTISPECIES: helix-turn-helix domain-containing protein [Streptomyces]KUN60839.1 PucR family transcriptional regulator [Streptomyces canus]MDI5905363.1 helix-turn-helix domain-containing protein [Streptomyces sp. 12257]